MTEQKIVDPNSLGTSTTYRRIEKHHKSEDRVASLFANLIGLLGLIASIVLAYSDHGHATYKGIQLGAEVFAVTIILWALIHFAIRPVFRKSGSEYLAKKLQENPDGIWCEPS